MDEKDTLTSQEEQEVKGSSQNEEAMEVPSQQEEAMENSSQKEQGESSQPTLTPPTPEPAPPKVWLLYSALLHRALKIVSTGG